MDLWHNFIDPCALLPVLIVLPNEEGYDPKEDTATVCFNAGGENKSGSFWSRESNFQEIRLENITHIELIICNIPQASVVSSGCWLKSNASLSSLSQPPLSSSSASIVWIPSELFVESDERWIGFSVWWFSVGVDPWEPIGFPISPIGLANYFSQRIKYINDWGHEWKGDDTLQLTLVWIDETAHPARPFVAPPSTPTIPAPWTAGASSELGVPAVGSMAVSGCKLNHALMKLARYELKKLAKVTIFSANSWILLIKEFIALNAWSRTGLHK